MEFTRKGRAGGRRIGLTFSISSLLLFWATPAHAADAPWESGGSAVAIGWVIAVIGSLVALALAYKFFLWMKEQDEGDERMVKIAGHVRDGANAYLWRQYKVVAIFFAVVCVLLAIVAFGFGQQLAECW